MCHDMVMPRLKRMMSLALEPELLDQLDAWLAQQQPRTSKTAVLEMLIRRFLAEEAEKAKGR